VFRLVLARPSQNKPIWFSVAVCCGVETKSDFYVVFIENLVIPLILREMFSGEVQKLSADVHAVGRIKPNYVSLAVLGAVLCGVSYRLLALSVHYFFAMSTLLGWNCCQCRNFRCWAQINKCMYITQITSEDSFLIFFFHFFLLARDE